MGLLVLFVTLKFLAYAALCAYAVRWFALEAPAVSFGLRWGAIRLVVGIAAGVPIAYLFTVMSDALPMVPAYLLSFVPLRLIEWSVVLLAFLGQQRRSVGVVSALGWIALGVSTSAGFDVVGVGLLELGNVKFFC